MFIRTVYSYKIRNQDSFLFVKDKLIHFILAMLVFGIYFCSHQPISDQKTRKPMQTRQWHKLHSHFHSAKSFRFSCEVHCIVSVLFKMFWVLGGLVGQNGKQELFRRMKLYKNDIFKIKTRLHMVGTL